MDKLLLNHEQRYIYIFVYVWAPNLHLNAFKLLINIKPKNNNKFTMNRSGDWWSHSLLNSNGLTKTSLAANFANTAGEIFGDDNSFRDINKFIYSVQVTFLVVQLRAEEICVYPNEKWVEKVCRLFNTTTVFIAWFTKQNIKLYLDVFIDRN